MSHHEETFAIDAADDDGGQRLLEFYRHNGYSVVDNDRGQAPWTLERGTDGASWWSSNMTKLKTRITIDRSEGGYAVTYRINTTGQHLTDDDRAFWRREASTAEDVLHDRRSIVDLRPREADRAEALKMEYRSFGLRAAVIIVVTIVITGIVGSHLGFL